MMKRTQEEVIKAVREYQQHAEENEMRELLAALSYLVEWGLITLEQWRELRAEYVAATNYNDGEE